MTKSEEEEVTDLLETQLIMAKWLLARILSLPFVPITETDGFRKSEPYPPCSVAQEDFEKLRTDIIKFLR